VEAEASAEAGDGAAEHRRLVGNSGGQRAVGGGVRTQERRGPRSWVHQLAKSRASFDQF